MRRSEQLERELIRGYSMLLGVTALILLIAVLSACSGMPAFGDNTPKTAEECRITKAPMNCSVLPEFGFKVKGE